MSNQRFVSIYWLKKQKREQQQQKDEIKLMQWRKVPTGANKRVWHRKENGANCKWWQIGWNVVNALLILQRTIMEASRPAIGRPRRHTNKTEATHHIIICSLRCRPTIHPDETYIILHAARCFSYFFFFCPLTLLPFNDTFWVPIWRTELQKSWMLQVSNGTLMTSTFRRSRVHYGFCPSECWVISSYCLEIIKIIK